MTTQRKIEIFAAVVFVLLAGVFLKGWILEREARIRAEVTVDAQQKIVASKDAAIASRDVVDAQYASAMAKQASAVKTPQQAAQVIVHYLPVTPGQPVETVQTITKADLSPAAQAKLPNSPSYDVLTAKQAQEVAKTELACDVAQHSLNTCVADKADLQAVVAAKTVQVNALQVAVKGGTKMQRFGRIAKSIACGSAGGAVGAFVANRNVAGAAVGAAAGVTACSLF